MQGLLDPPTERLEDAADDDQSHDPTQDILNVESQPVDADHDVYVSLNISRESDDNNKNSVYHQTTSVCFFDSCQKDYCDDCNSNFTFLFHVATGEGVCSDHER
jgi:hypothetical protein